MDDAQKLGTNIVRAVLVTVFYAGAALGAVIGALAVVALQ